MRKLMLCLVMAAGATGCLVSKTRADVIPETESVSTAIVEAVAVKEGWYGKRPDPAPGNIVIEWTKDKDGNTVVTARKG